MSKTLAFLSLALVVAAATPALARSHGAVKHRQPAYSAPAGKIDSGYYAPRTWDEIEISGPNSY